LGNRIRDRLGARLKPARLPPACSELTSGNRLGRRVTPTLRFAFGGMARRSNRFPTRSSDCLTGPTTPAIPSWTTIRPRLASETTAKRIRICPRVTIENRADCNRASRKRICLYWSRRGRLRRSDFIHSVGIASRAIRVGVKGYGIQAFASAGIYSLATRSNAAHSRAAHDRRNRLALAARFARQNFRPLGLA
jgi:hypothetical protein